MRLVPLMLTLLGTFPSSADETRRIECRFLRFGGETAPSIGVASAEGERIKCPLPDTAISSKVACPAMGNVISFVTLPENQPFAKARIPAGINSALLVFVKMPEPAKEPADKDVWRVMVLDDSRKGFPDGGALVANFHNKEIRFVIGEHKGMLKAGGFHGYAMPQQLDSFNMAPVIFQFQQGESWRTANESALRFLQGTRYLILAYSDPASGRPRINTYQDFVAPGLGQTPP
jgi:hypothetical protein